MAGRADEGWRQVDLRGYREPVRGSVKRHAASWAWNVFLSAVFLSL